MSFSLLRCGCSWFICYNFKCNSEKTVSEQVDEYLISLGTRYVPNYLIPDCVCACALWLLQLVRLKIMRVVILLNEFLVVTRSWHKKCAWNLKRNKIWFTFCICLFAFLFESLICLLCMVFVICILTDWHRHSLFAQVWGH